MEHSTDGELREAADELRERARNGESLDELLHECFALVREAGKRAMGMRHFDVQLIGGMVLHDGSIAEMKTGEGKTLTATLAVVLNSLAGRGVHVVTVNDYLARRDAMWMKPIYDMLGVSVGVLQNMQPYEDKRAAYAADVTYGTNSEFGFDYLRDNMAKSLEEKVQHGGRPKPEEGKSPYHTFAIVDEVDNILIDEARTPLIISGAPEQAADLYVKFARLAPKMVPGKTPEGMDPRSKKEFVADFDYEFDEKHKTVAITERGVAKAERFLGDRPPLPRRERPPGQPPDPVAEGRVALQARRRLRGDRRRGQDHRRVHGADPRGPALVGGPASGDRGQGGRARPGGEPDARDDHAAELLPDVRQARGDDRHGAHRGDRVHEDLQAAGRADPDQHADGPQGLATIRSTRPRTASGARSPGRSRRATTTVSRCSSGRSRSRSQS